MADCPIAHRAHVAYCVAALGDAARVLNTAHAYYSAADGAGTVVFEDARATLIEAYDAYCAAVIRAKEATK